MDEELERLRVENARLTDMVAQLRHEQGTAFPPVLALDALPARIHCNQDVEDIYSAFGVAANRYVQARLPEGWIWSHHGARFFIWWDDPRWIRDSDLRGIREHLLELGVEKSAEEIAGYPMNSMWWLVQKLGWWIQYESNDAFQPLLELLDKMRGDQSFSLSLYREELTERMARARAALEKGKAGR